MQNHCRQVKALTFQLLPNLQSREERERKAAIIIFTEVGACGGPSGTACTLSPAEPTRTSLDQQIPHTLPSHSQLLGAHGQGLLV